VRVAKFRSQGASSSGRRVTPGTNAIRREVISQSALAEYLRLKAERDELARQCETLRATLVGLLETGAPVEAGPRQATLRCYEVRPLPVATLTTLLGAERVASLRNQVAPQRRVQLIVGLSAGAVGRLKERLAIGKTTKKDAAYRNIGPTRR
jgi:hypothetical protein